MIPIVGVISFFSNSNTHREWVLHRYYRYNLGIPMVP